MKTSTAARVGRTPIPDPIFDGYMARVQRRLEALLEDPKARLFRTASAGLFELYLRSFPEAVRQHHNCHACRDFLERFGDLVTVDEEGRAHSAFWVPEEAPEPYIAPVLDLARVVEGARVLGVFFSAQAILGSPVTNGWTHLAVRLPERYTRLHNRALTPFQAEAEKREDFNNVVRALGEFTPEGLDQAVRVLESDALYRGEKLLGAATWLRDLQKMRREEHEQEVRRNRTWRAVALAPAGFCHPRGGMLGTLLADIEAGLSFNEIKRRFDEKMHPLQYQRPQAPPAEGTIVQAERLFAQLGLAPALRRRFARLDEIEAIWRPPLAKPAAPRRGGLFAHLRSRSEGDVKPLQLPAKRVTFEKFRETVLPNAEQLEFYAPHARRESYCALTTAADPAAPPILQWDVPEHRNPVAWYIYSSGSTPAEFGLAGGWAKVVAITFPPPRWGGRRDSHFGESALFCLEGCHDTRNGGLALFPECLKSELHGVRSVVEAHSRGAVIEKTDGELAAGYWFQLHRGCERHFPRFRVTTRGGTAEYELDRWD